MKFFLAGILVASNIFLGDARDEKCEWSSHAGVSFDLNKLTKTGNQDSYLIKDGDIPCTPETEPTYSFVWNFCADVTEVSVPSVCPEEKRGSAIQYLIRKDDYKECEVIGHYDPNNDDSHFQLVDDRDPSKGVSIEYRAGDRCPSGVFRTSTIDVLCSNKESLIVSALEPTLCGYRMVMESYYGCPKGCPVTENGLCNSHGHCAYDKAARAAYCYCNYGFYGDACSETTAPLNESYDGFSVQVGLLVVLLLITLGLTGVVGLMVYRINEYRKEQHDSNALDGPSMHHFMLHGDSQHGTHNAIHQTMEMRSVHG